MPRRHHDSDSPELVILHELLTASPDYLSGQSLARTLGMSRVAVWQHMEKLRAQGFEFEAKHARGYRIAATPLELHPTYIEHLLRSHGRDALPFSVHDSVDSTNDEATRQLARGAPVPFVILAREQTQGRGRFKRRWQSGKHGNLYSSFVFRPELPPQRMPTFTLWLGVSICELIHTLLGLPARIKWPNDLVFGNRKCGGILTEARIDADQMRDLVFGLGLNVNQAAGTWADSDLRRPATSLRIEAGRTIDINHLTAALIGRIHLAYTQFIADDYRPQLTELWAKHDALHGQKVVVLNGTQRIEGTASGIDESGNLLLRPSTQVGEAEAPLLRFAAGEVTLETAEPRTANT
ncbi:hypothetical protein AXK12_06035 [Cephaloticoccus capnophilus]|uniref:Bifunctional ligase/repressor BirA n=1 Tax=Cephaloticoccus capnophilus TaxID=1548208 RepID=A0A139SL27_9BACT|nr:biotin--[acetyl-CoA-carboxylase] ligase [Cephaloticoccus capnophilus]KXU35256.1 hypothetical protein AXK12_06035 [Cephaloticoccus capnophilus]